MLWFVAHGAVQGDPSPGHHVMMLQCHVVHQSRQEKGVRLSSPCAPLAVSWGACCMAFPADLCFICASITQGVVSRPSHHRPVIHTPTTLILHTCRVPPKGVPKITTWQVASLVQIWKQQHAHRQTSFPFQIHTMHVQTSLQALSCWLS